MSLNEWTPADILAYKSAIKRAPKTRKREEAKRQRKLDELFERLHGQPKGGGA